MRDQFGPFVTGRSAGTWDVFASENNVLSRLSKTHVPLIIYSAIWGDSIVVQIRITTAGFEAIFS